MEKLEKLKNLIKNKIVPNYLEHKQTFKKK